MAPLKANPKRAPGATISKPKTRAWRFSSGRRFRAGAPRLNCKPRLGFCQPKPANRAVVRSSDNLGTVRDLAEYDEATDTTAIVDYFVWDSFGNETSGTFDFLFGFTGRAFDHETGLQNNLNRWFDPVVGRWLSEDPIGFAAGDVNVYRYVGNFSTGAIDPSGLFDWGFWFVDAPLSAGAGIVQGGANIVNGLQDTGIGVANLPAMGVNSIAWAEEKVGILDPKHNIRMPYIPSPDWSKNLIVNESETSHGASKFCGAGGVEILTGIWISKLEKLKALTELKRFTNNKPWNKLWGKGIDDAAEALERLRRGERILPEGIDRKALDAYDEIARRALNDPDKATEAGRKLQELRRQIIKEVKKQCKK